MQRKGREVSFRQRDLWITAAASIPLGILVILVLRGAGQLGYLKPREPNLLLLAELGALISPVGALGGGMGFLLATRRLYVRTPWLLVTIVALGSGLSLWFTLLMFALTKLNAAGVVGLGQILIELFVPVVLCGAIPAALGFGTLTWIRLRVPPPPGTELGAYRGPEGGPHPLPKPGG